MVQLLKMPFKCFIHASVIKPLTYCFLAEGTLNAVMGFCRVTVTFGGLLFKAWGHFLCMFAGWMGRL